jgi:outer membrane biosynthesis protein TonB
MKKDKDKEREFDDLLEECLGRVLRGEPVESCLVDYPEHAPRLQPLLLTALETRQAAAIRPRPEFRERARYQFQAALRDMEPKEHRGFFSWQPRWVTAVVAIFAVLVIGSGTVAAAGNSLPGEPLYSVKLATESVRLAFTPSDLGKAELYAQFADKRVDEIIAMADKGNTEQVEMATERMNSQLVAMTNLVGPAEEGSGDWGLATSEAEQPPAAPQEAPQLRAEEAPMLAVEETAPAPAPTPVPVPVPAPAPAPTPAPVPVEEIPSVHVEQVPAKAGETAPVVAPKVDLSSANAQLAQVDEADIEYAEADDRYEKLRQLLVRQALENPEALREVLEKVPESMRAELIAAIEQAVNSYDQALKNLER